jgi:hypothetical protein
MYCLAQPMHRPIGSAAEAQKGLCMTVVDIASPPGESPDVLDCLANALFEMGRATITPRRRAVDAYMVMSPQGDITRLALPDPELDDADEWEWTLEIFEAARTEQISAWGHCDLDGTARAQRLRVRVEGVTGPPRAYEQRLRVSKGEFIFQDAQPVDEEDLSRLVDIEPPSDDGYDDLKHLRNVTYPDDWTARKMDEIYRQFVEVRKTEYFGDALEYVGREYEYSDGEVCKIFSIAPCEPREDCFAIAVDDGGRNGDWICIGHTKRNRKGRLRSAW